MFIETVENSSVRENSFIIFPFLFNNTSFSSAKVHGEVYLVQHYVINFVSDLRMVGGFLWVLRFSPPVKLTPTI